MHGPDYSRLGWEFSMDAPLFPAGEFVPEEALTPTRRAELIDATDLRVVHDAPLKLM